MIFDNWFEKIKGNREHFIEYYVQQLGEENRSLITEQFDSLKFCFYINPNDIEDWVNLKSKDDYVVATYQFLKDYASELDIDISSVQLIFNDKFEELSINTDDENNKNKIKNLFMMGSIGYFDIPDDHYFDNLYSFRDLEDFEKGEGKRYSNPAETLLQRRLLFLRDMGDILIEGRPIDYYGTEECRKFVNSSKFKVLLNKYQDLAKAAFQYKKEVDLGYQDLIDYMRKQLSVEQQIIKKYDELKRKVNDSKKINEYEKECKREIASLRIVCGNFDFSSSLDENAALECIVDSIHEQNTLCCNDDLNNQEIVIFFCPFRSIPGYEDVDLRHEIRHGITSSLSIDGNNTTFKIGNKIEKIIGEERVECQLSDYNEWVTQIEAKKETKDAFSKGIYIISKPCLKNHNFLGKTSIYDSYLPLFEIVYSALPLSAKRSQIEISNDSLYNAIPLTQLIDIEEMILNGYLDDDELIDELHNISEQLKSNVVKR